MSKFFLGPVKNPTWKDFVIRVGGAMAFIVVVIFSAKEFIPEHVGISVIVTSLVLIAFVGIQEVRHNMHKKTSKKLTRGRSTK
ncbi:MAG: hypothetical protein K8F26_10335 [Thiobacillus sp.]|nr:hypothetical protein [Thiobacillus sp.]